MSKMLYGPEDNTDIPRGSMGKIFNQYLKNQDQNEKFLIDAKTNQKLTFGDLDKFSSNLASYLKKIDLAKNDTIAVISENTLNVVIPILAGLYLACPVHLLNPNYTSFELKGLLDLSKPKIIFCSEKAAQTIQTLSKELNYIDRIISFNEKFNQLIQTNFGEIEIEENFDPKDQVALIFNSSGTTGFPKGVMLTHDNIRYVLMPCKIPGAYDKGNNDSTIILVPFYHIYGSNILFSCLWLGAKALVMDEFKPDLFLSTIQTHQITVLFLVPTLINFLANTKLFDQYDVSSVIDIASTGSAGNEEYNKVVSQRFKVKNIRQAYGLTETSTTVCMVYLNRYKSGSVGQLLPDRILKVINNGGTTLGANQVGELCFKGGIMKGYVNNEQQTNETIDSDGFLHTGDVGYFDDEGFVFIVDRMKDLIKYKSFQVSPIEVEHVLMLHPAVVDCGVVGKKDERFGELPTAIVVREKNCLVSEEEICEFVAQKLSIPKRLHGGVRFVEEIPKNSLGKIVRTKLKEML